VLTKFWEVIGAFRSGSTKSGAVARVLQGSPPPVSRPAEPTIWNKIFTSRLKQHQFSTAARLQSAQRPVKLHKVATPIAGGRSGGGTSAAGRLGAIMDHGATNYAFHVLFIVSFFASFALVIVRFG
jgi:hypothetical protein